jgi:protein ImuB
MPTPEKPSARKRDAAPTPPESRERRKPGPRQLALTGLPPAEPALQPVVPLRFLWLGIYLPALPLEALVDTPEPAAVFEDRQGLRHILLANRQAGAAGIGPGLAVNAALALLPALRLEERDPLREAQVLGELAEWAETFTSFTSIEPPSLLVLEIAGSVNLFGGLRALRERIVRGLDSQGFAASVAIAPTPLAATWLARAGRRVCIRDPRNLVGRLAPLPLSCLGWPGAVEAALKGMGVATIGDTLRLPRPGFARRFGAARLLDLDRALGRLPDPRAAYRSPEPFIADIDLGEELDDADLLLNACRELLLQLERFLRSRQTAVQHIEFGFFHLQRPATQLGLGCVQPDRAVRHWFDLLEIRFERLRLAAPVIAIRLNAGQGRDFAVASEALPLGQQGRKRPAMSITHLAERLSARIGEQSVHGVMTVAEHRPQYAWRNLSEVSETPHCASTPGFAANAHAPALLADLHRTSGLVLQRPLWILEPPRRLRVERGVPCYRGGLELVRGPERIETGWWDEDGIARDYFVATNPQGVHLWVYRDRGKAGHWFLHGKFG